jgi:hypothetical protein
VKNMSEIKLFKLTSGEEIMAQVVSPPHADVISITDAVALVYQQAGDSRMTVGFAPFMPYSNDKPTTLYYHAIAASADPTAQILGEYNRVFSKIVIAPAGSIV